MVIHNSVKRLLRELNPSFARCFIKKLVLFSNLELEGVPQGGFEPPTPRSSASSLSSQKSREEYRCSPN